MRDRLSSIGAVVRGVFFKAAVSLSLIPPYLAGITWRLLDKFLQLVNEGYRRNAVVYACIRLLASAVPEAPLQVYQTGGKQDALIPNHPLRLLMQRPNPYLSEFEFWELTVTNLSIVGQAFWWKERSNVGQVIGLWPLRPDRIEPILGPTARGLLAGWRYWLDGAHYDLPANDVLVFNYPDPSDDTGGVLGGLGPLQVLAREVDTDNEATSFVYAMLRNYAMPGIIITSKAKLNQAEANRLKENFASKYGDMQRGRPAVIDADTTVQPLSHSLKNLEFPDVRALGEARIAAAFGVPAILVGLKVGLDRSTFNNMAEAREFMAETTLSVLWRRLSDQVQLDLVPEFDKSGRTVVRFDSANVRALAGQQREKAKRYDEAFGRGALSLNEYRQHGLGLDALAPAQGDVYFVPNTVTVVPLAELGQPKPQPTPLALPPGDPMQEGKRLALAAHKAAGVSVARRRRDSLARPFAAALSSEFRNLGERIVERLRADWPEPGKAQTKDDSALPLDPLTAGDEDAFAQLLREHLVSVIAKAAATAGVELGIDVDDTWSLPPDDALALVDELATRIVGINGTTRSQVREAIRAALAAGEGIDGLAKRISKLVEETWPRRAETIARTETGNAYNLGTLRSYRASGLVTYVTVLDGAECGWTRHDDGDKANGSRRTVSEAQGYPLCHPNCVRAFSAVVD